MPCCPVLLSFYCIVIVSLKNEINRDGDMSFTIMDVWSVMAGSSFLILWKYLSYLSIVFICIQLSAPLVHHTDVFIQWCQQGLEPQGQGQGPGPSLQGQARDPQKNRKKYQDNSSSTTITTQR